MTAYMDFPLFETVRTQDKWLLVFLYSYQIYADFFGYTTIAIGLGLLFGYRLPVNFNLPYVSASFSEFWTRWHISLSTWLRTYLYIPLGGNRLGTERTYLNIMIVMGLGDLWHGAGLSYLAWGTMHGVLLVLQRTIFGNSVEEIKKQVDDIQAKAAANGHSVKIGVNAFAIARERIGYRLVSGPAFCTKN
jgi:alginate O-acetyltransferase complex protein AlgI